MNNSHSDPDPLTRSQILVVMGFTAILLLIIAKIWQKAGSIAILPINVSWNALLWSLLLCTIIIGASSIVYRLWSSYRRSAEMYLSLILKPLAWPDLIWVGLLPGLSEELLFRGVMLSALGLNITALIVSSIVFGVVHLSGVQQWPYGVWATAVGLLLGYSALATGNLLVPIVAHTLTNLISSCFWKASHPPSEGLKI